MCRTEVCASCGTWLWFSLSSCRYAGWTGHFQGFLSLSCRKVTLENLRQVVPFLALGSLARTVALQRRCWFRAEAETHEAQTDASEQAGERRRGKKIRDNVFNLIRPLESLKCILPWLWNSWAEIISPTGLFAEDSGCTGYDACEISGLLKYCPLVLRDRSSLSGNQLSLPAS